MARYKGKNVSTAGRVVSLSVLLFYTVNNRGKEAGWLYACPETRHWVAAYHGLAPAPLTLTVPGGKVEVEAMGTGTVVWDDGTVTVEAVGLQGTPQVLGGKLA